MLVVLAREKIFYQKQRIQNPMNCSTTKKDLIFLEEISEIDEVEEDIQNHQYESTRKLRDCETTNRLSLT